MNTGKVISYSGAFLIAALLNTAFAVDVFAATDVAITNFRASWSSTTTYAAGAVVTYDGASYISLVNRNTGIPPNSSTTDWAILNAPGATGAAGPQGEAGPTG